MSSSSIAKSPNRVSAVPQEPFVVFVIGMRINKLWRVDDWGPVAVAMPRMLSELRVKPELGFICGHVWFARTIVMIQYWRSVEALNAYAAAPEGAHLPAWRAFNRNVRGAKSVGIFHETYSVEPGAFETVYVNMPPFGLGRAFGVVPAEGALASAEGRMKAARRP